MFLIIIYNFSHAVVTNGDDDDFNVKYRLCVNPGNKLSLLEIPKSRPEVST